MSALKDRREALGFTLRDVESITDGRVSNAYLSQLENGKIEAPSIQMACDLAAALCVPIETMAEWLTTPIVRRQPVICETCGRAIQ